MFQFIQPTGSSFSKLDVSGDINLDGPVTINESGADVDFRVEGVGQANALFVQGSDGYVGVGTGTPAAEFDVNGNILIADNGYIGSASDTDAIKIGSGGDVTFTSTRVGTAEGSYNSIIGSAFGSKSGFTYCDVVGTSIGGSATGNVTYNSITGYNIANASTDSIRYNSITGYNIANAVTGNVYFNSITGYNITNAVTGNVYRNSIIGYSIANVATGSVSYNSITGDTIANTATGSIQYNSITGSSIANTGVTSNVECCFSIGYRNAEDISNETNLSRVIALPYESLYQSSATDLTDAIALGYRAGYQNAYNSPALFGREATATAANQVVIGSSFYTGGILLDKEVTINDASDVGQHLLTLDQDDDDEPFIKYDGTSAADQTKNISTVNGDGAVEGPKNYSSTAGWQYEGMIRIDVNGTDYWMPYYSADVS